jgi:ribonuclease P protein component
LKHTIKANTEVNSIFAEAEKSTQKDLIILCATELPERDHSGRVAYLAGKRLGNAPQRNRAKRMLREAARKQGAPWQGLRVVLIARETCADARLEDICHEIDRGLKALTGRMQLSKELPVKSNDPFDQGKQV